MWEGRSPSLRREKANQWLAVAGGVAVFVIVFVIVPGLFGGGPRLTLAPTKGEERKEEEKQAAELLKQLTIRKNTLQHRIELQMQKNEELDATLLDLEIQLNAPHSNCAGQFQLMASCFRQLQYLINANHWLIDRIQEGPPPVL
jgi:hypothetical protein